MRKLIAQGGFFLIEKLVSNLANGLYVYRMENFRSFEKNLDKYISDMNRGTRSFQEIQTIWKPSLGI